MRPRLTLAVVALAVGVELVPAAVSSQQPSTAPAAVQLGVGERVRFRLARAPRQRHVGTIEQAGDGQLRVRVDGWTRLYVIRMEEFSELQVRGGRGSRGRGAVTGALTGLLIGGLLFALPTPEPDAFVGPQTRGEAALLGGILGGAIGALVGAASPGHLWVDVPLPAPGAGTAPDRIPPTELTAPPSATRGFRART